MAARLIDGKAIAAEVRDEVAAEVVRFRDRYGRAPGLATVLVGDDPASRVYVGSKRKGCEEVGIRSLHHQLAVDVEPDHLLAVVAELNADPGCDGILVQLPLPVSLDSAAVIAAIDPAKDVDGLTALNAGRLAQGDRAALIPCTPRGAMRLLAATGVETAGATAVVLGRSVLVGRPMAALLSAADATVTLCHSRTRDLAAVCATADILVAAVGRPEMVRGDWIKPGATVIDVGINRTESGLVGDVAFAEAAGHAAAITPVPGGVGPMTIAMLFANTLSAARARAPEPAEV